MGERCHWTKLYKVSTDKIPLKDELIVIKHIKKKLTIKSSVAEWDHHNLASSNVTEIILNNIENET